MQRSITLAYVKSNDQNLDSTFFSFLFSYISINAFQTTSFLGVLILFVKRFPRFSIESVKSIRQWNPRKMQVRVYFIFAVGLEFIKTLSNFNNLLDIVRTEHLLSSFFCMYLANLYKMKFMTVLICISLFHKCKIILSKYNLGLI